MGNVILDDNLSLSLYVMPTVCYIVIILDDQGAERREILVRV